MKTVTGLALLANEEGFWTGLLRQQVIQGSLGAGELLEDPDESRLEGADKASLDASLLGCDVVGALPVERDAGEALRLDAVALFSRASALVAGA